MRLSKYLYLIFFKNKVDIELNLILNIQTRYLNRRIFFLDLLIKINFKNDIHKNLCKIF